MCGIAGWAVHGRIEDPDAALAKMQALIRHRGPDGSGSLVLETSCRQVALAMTRLAIIDVAGGRQPMRSEDGRVAAVCNGEIYNHASLRRELEKRGHSFATRSDVEVIVHLYEEHGLDAFARLDGMFAIALHDGEQLVLVRDRLGIKPLYLAPISAGDGAGGVQRGAAGGAAGGEGIAFASEAKALTALLDLRPDPGAIATYLAWGYMPAPLTPFEGVSKLAAGHLALWRPGVLEVRPWWELEATGRNGARAGGGQEAVRASLESAIKSHLMSEVPLGAFLSGGLDSSVVVALMTKAAGPGVKTFTVGFEGAGTEGLDERDAARAVARHCHADHTELIVEATPERLATELAWLYDEPAGDEAAYPTYLMAEAAREHVTVVLTGEGGDEAFAGYAKYAELGRWASLSRVPSPIRSAMLKAAGLLAGAARAGKLARVLNAPPAGRGIIYDEVFSPEERRALLAPGIAGDVKAPPMPAGWEDADGLAQMQIRDINGFLADGLLQKVDRTTMACSLEARVPLLDHRVVEAALALPTAAKISGGHGKAALRTIARDLLPTDIVEMPKHGFTIPIESWMLGPLRQLVDELLDPERLGPQGFFQATAVSALVARHRAGDRRAARRVWLLLAWQLWHERFFERRS